MSQLTNQFGRADADDSLWRAFQYVAGELSEHEADVFEQQMLDDVRLCDAVVEATRISVSVAADSGPGRRSVTLSSSSQSTDQRQALASRRPVFAAVAASLACVCLVWAVSAMTDPTDSDSSVAVADDQDAEMILSVWADESQSDLDSLDELGGLDDQSLDVPDWMLTAVTIADLDADPNDSQDMDL